MSKTKLQIKRTSVTGRLPNTSDPANTSYIDAGELAINLTDEKVFSSNGTLVFEVGANLTNLTVSSNASLKAIVANGNIGTNNQVLVSNGTGIYWSSVAGGGDTLTEVEWYPANSTLTINTTATSISQTFNYANSSTPGLISLVDSTSNTAANIAASANSVKVAFDAAGNAYSNATSFAANADNISSGTLNTARLPATVNVATAINVGSNVNITVDKINVGNSSINSFLSSSSLIISGNKIQSLTYVSSNTNSQSFDSFSAAAFRSAQYNVQLTSGTDYHVINLSLVHDGTDVYLAQYGEIFDNVSLATFDANIISSNVELLFVPANAVTTVKAIVTLIST